MVTSRIAWLALVVALALVAQGCTTDDANSDAGPDATDSTAPGASSDPDLPYPDPSTSYLQHALADLGYPIGTIDGVYGPATTDALAAFQRDNGLDADGHLDRATAEALEQEADATEHLMVESIQTQLTELGHPVEVDGVWGDATEAAIEAFQTELGLDPSGILDDVTHAALVDTHHAENVAAHREAAEASGTGGEVHETRPTVPEGQDDDYLREGDQGDDVKDVQDRLVELGYRPGDPDGNFGAHTASAVLAFQKREGLTRDGIVGPEVLARLDDPRGAGPRSDQPGPRVEVDLDRQVMFVIDASGGVTTLNTSTGSGKEFQSAEPGKGIVVAHTPVGDFEILRVIDGLRQAPLGTLYRPMYFTNEGGFAIHGNPNVPAYPASHGCARLANYDMDFVWSAGLAVGDGVSVYGDNPPAPDNAAGGF